MMRILMTADAVGGVWTYAMELSRALAPYGVEVILATMGDAPSQVQRHEADRIGNLTLHTRDYKLEWMPDPWDDVDRAGEWLRELEHQTHPDVIHLNGYAHAALGWRAPVLVVGHSCVLSWWAAVKRQPLPDHWLDYASRVSRGLHAAARVVAPSQAMVDCLHRHYRGLPKSTAIYNGRSRQPFKRAVKESFILSAGRLWDEAKNLGVLNDAARQLSWPVLVAGDSPPDSQTTHVRCLGRLNERDLANQMSHAPIYVLPARYEPFGLSVLEAALSGCALVLGDIRSLREIWGDAATFVAPDDADALAKTLRRHIQEPAFCLDMSRRAMVRARRYTLVRMASEYLTLYQELDAANPVRIDHGTNQPLTRCE